MSVVVNIPGKADVRRWVIEILEDELAKQIAIVAGKMESKGGGSARKPESIDELCFSTRALTELRNAEITTIDDLCSRSRTRLAKYLGMGRRTLNDIEVELARAGRCLSKE